MPLFFIDLDGGAKDEDGTEFASVDEARNAAVERLGVYLQANPEFAYRQHWRVDLRDSSKRLVLYVIVGTVMAAPQINWDSFDEG